VAVEGVKPSRFHHPAGGRCAVSAAGIWRGEVFGRGASPRLLAGVGRPRGTGVSPVGRTISDMGETPMPLAQTNKSGLPWRKMLR
jgi:hypothetical protein